MSLLKSKTFCVLPWIEKYQNLDGMDYVCCHSAVPVLPSELDSIRTKILNQESVPHCESCYKLDQQRVISPRLQESARWLKDNEIKSYIEQWKPSDADSTFFYDLRFDNKCNLACIGCGPKASSLWEKELGIESRSIPIRFNTQDMVRSKKIYMAGGEPLIIDQYIDLLNHISKQTQQPEIVINTNLTRVSTDMQKTLEQIKNLTLVISVDAVGRVNEYHRWPMKWNKFINNLSWAKNIDCTIQFNTVIDAVSIMNAADLVDLEHDCDLWNLSILKNPSALEINNLPDSMRTQIKDQWNKIRTSKFFKSDPTFKSRVDHVTDLLDRPGNYESLRDYITELDKRRNIQHRDFLPMEFI